ncbi:sensor histidine kinase [Sphingomonas sp. CV7422]|uniref:sensor histidine kinase n=1 Tax=Sphingomonas sp. CV7422 TaxID=3018036 RepID=UPI0022FF022C|nr:sensor histidine kinase [Sphingomonas sp. CV7422]
MPLGDPAAAADPIAPLAWHAAADGAALRFLRAADDAVSVHPDDYDRLGAQWRRAAGLALFSADVRVRLAPAEAYRWLRLSGVPDADGWQGVAVDVTDLCDGLASERRRRYTLHHRVRNTLAIIRSIARRTAETSETIDDYRYRFDGRLAAVARTQSQIMGAGDRGVDLETLLVDALLAHQLGGRVDYGGPEVRLPPQLAEQFGLALHELTDNAVQHGALSRDDGTLAVRWTVEEAPDAQLRLDWNETSRDGACPPAREGFGLELLTRALAYEIDAEVTLTFGARGMTCRIRLPLAAPHASIKPA